MKTKTETKLKVSEVFYSIIGEGFHIGEPAIFIRLYGCDCRCEFCDTKYAWSGNVKDFPEHFRDTIKDKQHPYTEIETSKLVDKINELILKEAKTLIPGTVVVTGGEPMIQNIAPLIEQLHYLSYRIHLETNGHYLLEKHELINRETHKWNVVKDVNYITISPKFMFQEAHDKPDFFFQKEMEGKKIRVPNYIDEIKLIYDEHIGLEGYNRMFDIHPRVRKYIQPDFNRIFQTAKVNPPNDDLKIKENKFLGLKDNEYFSTLYFDILRHPEWKLSTQVHRILGFK